MTHIPSCNDVSAQSAQSAPNTYHGLAALLRLNFEGVDLRPLCQSLIETAFTHADEAGALLDAALIFQFYGDPAMALRLQNEAIKLCRVYKQPQREPGTPRLRLLALVTPGALMANVPIECLFEAGEIELTLYYTTLDETDPTLPEHDVLFVAIGESDANRPLLEAWIPRLENWHRPVLNHPAAIERVTRDTAAALLAPMPGSHAPSILMPITARFSRDELAPTRQAASLSMMAEQRALNFPLLVRPVGSHAGHDFHKVDHPCELTAALTNMPGDEFFISPFIDYRSHDGLFRKYRVILIDGRPFACHMGISSHWMIHYLNAGMADSPEKRAEEARFMASFETEFAPKHKKAFADITQLIGLDYLGIDCAEMADGRLLIFEVDHAMVVHAMDPVDVYPYKQAAMKTLFAAFHAMVFKAAENAASNFNAQ